MNSAIRLLPCLARLLPAVALLTATASCSTLHNTAATATTHREPEFQMRLVDEALLGGLDVLPLCEPADVNLPQRNQLIAGYVNKALPLRMRVQLNAYNPNPTPAAITGLVYTVIVDGKALGGGRQPMAVELPASDSVRVPLTFELNTYKYLGDDALPALRNFALGFGDVRRQRVTLRVRPLLRAPKGHFTNPINRSAVARDEAPAMKTSLRRSGPAGQFRLN